MAWAIQQSVFIQMAQRRRPNQSSSFTPVRFPGSPPLAKPLSETQVHIERLLVLQHVVTRPRQLVRERLERQDPIRPALLAIIETLGLRTAAQRKVRRFHERPGEILVPVLGVAFTLPLAVALLQAVNAAAVRTEVPHLSKSTDGAGLEHDCGRQDVADAWHGLSKWYSGPKITSCLSRFSSASICCDRVWLTARLASTASATLGANANASTCSAVSRLTASPFIRAPVCR